MKQNTNLVVQNKLIIMPKFEISSVTGIEIVIVLVVVKVLLDNKKEIIIDSSKRTHGQSVQLLKSKDM